MKKQIFALYILFSVSVAIATAQAVRVLIPESKPPANEAAKNKSVFRDMDMILLAEKEPRKFVIGENSQSFTANRTVSPFRINRYETDYRLWYEVKTWAEKHGYKFKNPGQEGSKGRRARAPQTDGGFEPVTMINWYDAVVWCNALSERHGFVPCYKYEGKILRDSSDTAQLDLCDCDWDSDGYRLPSEAEWEFAARLTPNGFQRGDLASGETSPHSVTSTSTSSSASSMDDEITESDVAWIDANTNSTHPVGTSGTLISENTLSGTGYANGADVFDMSGNVLEFCWDWFADYTEQKGTRATGPEIGSERVCRGGSWAPYTAFRGAGDRYSFDPNETYNYMGFRIAQSAEKNP